MISRYDILMFLEEDAPYGDLTTTLVVPNQECEARIVSRQEGVIAGVDLAACIFSEVGATFIPGRENGERFRAGEVVATVHGPAHGVLIAERTALNLLGRMSGIATATRRLVDLVHEVNPSCRVAATRKTCPGLRGFDKSAVVTGGGIAHRHTLSDGILIKDNHLALVPLERAVALARAGAHLMRVEVEVESPDTAVEAARAGAEALLLDNMTPAVVRATVTALEVQGLRSSLILEVSGGVTEGTIRDYASCDIDIISTGAITHSVQVMDFSLEIIPKG
ncbi:MAG: carboxylating nicotinate-nucleotide diphosphorylase [Methanomicrobiales archaeon]|nr:carboxylating nicotinate-nucleotide diphosphorylase [Methanomicrobiales archaeon]